MSMGMIAASCWLLAGWALDALAIDYRGSQQTNALSLRQAAAKLPIDPAVQLEFARDRGAKRASPEVPGGGELNPQALCRGYRLSPLNGHWNRGRCKTGETGDD